MIHWFKKHPHILQSESNGLSSDSNYRELFQKRDELLVSHGYILVRLDRVYKFPILIVYPHASPYVLPQVYPLKRELTEEEVNAIAASLNSLPPENSIEYYYNLRHQNKTGVLCFLEWDSFDDGGQFYGITSILQRIRDWYSGHITGNFPPEGEEVAFSSHFNNICKQFQLIYPETFVNSANFQGEFYGIFNFEIPKDGGGSVVDAIYSGLHISGVGRTGISSDQPIALKVPDLIFEQGLETSFDLLAKPALVKRLTDEGDIIHGMWFDIDSEPAPFQHFSELVEIIGNGDRDAGISRLTEMGITHLRLLPKDFQVAIRFPNRKGGKEFQSFLVHKIQTPQGLPLFTDPVETMKVLVDNYDFVEAVICEKFTEESFFQRNSQRADRNLLKRCTVNVIGAGALGSEIADCIAKAGVRRVFLVDNQRLSIHNIVRHLAGIRHTGLLKVDAVAHYLKEHNPFIEIIRIAHSVTACDISTELPRNSMTISSIADDNIENFLNEQAVIVRKPMFYVRALRGGKVGRIVRVVAGQDACLNCLRLYREEKDSSFINIPVDPNFPTLRNECNNPIIPASAADLKIIAAVASRLLIDYLQDVPSEQNHWVWSTEEIPGTPINNPFSLCLFRRC